MRQPTMQRALTLLLPTLALLAASCSTDNPGPATSVPNPEPPPAQPTTITLRVTVSDFGSSSNVQPEVWLRGAGSWYPDITFGSDLRNFPDQVVGSDVELFFYPLGRDVPEIVVNVPITSDLCALGCARDVIHLELWDDRFEVWGATAESQVIQRD